MSEAQVNQAEVHNQTLPAPKKGRKPKAESSGEVAAKPQQGPKLLKRALNGLIEGLEYKYDELGSVDWKATIPQKFLCPNEAWFKSRKKDVPASIEGLEDAQLIILLAGLKWAAKIRGFTSVDYQVIQNPAGQLENCIVKCTINWKENYESPACSYSEIASCNAKNADAKFSLKFAEAIAANRAFSRCVRNYLNINIVTDVEIEEQSDEKIISDIAKKESVTSVKTDPVSIFIKAASDSGLSTAKDIVEFVNKLSPPIDGLSLPEDADLDKISKTVTVKQARLLISAVKNREKAF